MHKTCRRVILAAWCRCENDSRPLGVVLIWSVSDCFRDTRTGTLTTRSERIETPAGVEVVPSSCQMTIPIQDSPHTSPAAGPASVPQVGIRFDDPRARAALIMATPQIRDMILSYCDDGSLRTLRGVNKEVREHVVPYIYETVHWQAGQEAPHVSLQTSMRRHPYPVTTRSEKRCVD